MRKLSMFAVLGILLFTVGCDLTFTNNEAESPGTLNIYLTDAPFDFDIVKEANIVITRIDIRNESDSAEEKYLTIFDDSASFNLLELRNGITDTLLVTEIPAGKYNSLRVYVSDASILLTDQRVFELKVPSGEQSGIKVKIKPDIEVVTGLSSDILLDFDLSKSFVLQGNSKDPDKIKGFHFKPVVRAVNYTTAGTIAGTVTDREKNLLEHIEVWIESDTLVSTAYTNADGIYGLLGIPAGTYSMYATGEGFDTAVHRNIEVIEANRMMKNFTLKQLN